MNVIFIEHALDARQDAFCVSQNPHCFTRWVVLLSLQVWEGDRKNPHLRAGDSTQTCLPPHRSATTEFHLWSENKKRKTLKNKFKCYIAR